MYKKVSQLKRNNNIYLRIALGKELDCNKMIIKIWNFLFFKKEDDANT